MKHFYDKVVIVLFFVIMIPLLLVFIVIFFLFLPFLYFIDIPNRKRKKQFLLEYSLYLKEIEGSVFFCYSNRKNTLTPIQEIVIPKLDKSINIVFLNGRSLQTNHNIKFISHAIHMKSVKGFPFIMKVINSEMKYVSLHDELYSAINKKSSFDYFLEKVKFNIESQ